MLLTLRGTPFLYYGEEIGMRDISLKRSEILDPPGKRYWPFHKGRDGCRSPMQWENTPYGGFSPAKTWLPVHPNFQVRNVASQQKDPTSMLNFTRNLIRLRREKDALRHGDFKLLTENPRDVLAYLRQTPEQTILVALNFKMRSTNLENIPSGKWNLLHSTARNSVPENAQRLQLAPYEVVILEAV